MDPSGDGGGGLTATGLVCGSCGTGLPPDSRFCNKCGTPITHAAASAEYKQVTVLFADVVHSMDIAAAVGAERLREIMAELVERCAAVVKRYGGTVDKFTGDGIMAVFGAPVAMEDHAVRACLAAMAVQEEANRLAAEVLDRDGVELRLRIGLNSGQVIAGEIGSGSFGYTAVGEQVGMAQRMESVAPPGGVMLSASTARLVDGVAALGAPQMLHIKGADKPVAAQRLVSMEERHHLIERVESNLVGRQWEMSAVEGLLHRAIDGHGAVVGVVGPPGIGKSRLVREVSAMAATRGVEVFTAFCESHASQVPFHAVARLLRAATGVDALDGQTARDRVRKGVPDADPEDLLLFDDLLGVGDPDIPLPSIDPDARRRRLTALVNAAALARETQAVYVIEDAHWIDEVSESMIAEFLTVIPQTPSLVMITYRPEYRGALTRVANVRAITVAPLTDSETAALVSELLGPDSSVGELGQTIAESAAGNPFYAEEIVRDLAERGVLRGNRSAYASTADVADVSVPATLQATIAARIDRLDAKAKRTLGAAAVVGSRFDIDLLSMLGIEPVVGDLLAAQLIDQVSFAPHAEYVFLHPLIRTVAYESQLKSDRAQMHRCLAEAIEQKDSASADVNAALIAKHLEAAGDLRAAFAWHMRAAAWLNFRDIAAAHMSWRRARQVADRLPHDDPDRLSMRIAPRTLLCGSQWRAGGDLADTGFDELRELTIAAGDRLSLAIGMAGQVTALAVHARYREASRLASQCASLLESIGDPTLTVALLYAPLGAKFQTGEMSEVLHLVQRIAELAEGDSCRGDLIVESALQRAIAYQNMARACLGLAGWKDAFDLLDSVEEPLDPQLRALGMLYRYGVGVPNGVALLGAAAMRETAELLEFAKRAGDDLTLAIAQFARGLTLVEQEGSDRRLGFDLLAEAREAALQQRFNMVAVVIIDIELAKEKARNGEIDGAIELARAVIDDEYDTGEMIFRGPATSVLVESLLQRGANGDVAEARAAMDRLAAVPTEPGFVLHELPLLRLRALLAQGSRRRGRATATIGIATATWRNPLASRGI